ncbi:MAG: lysine--tRNA ligase [Acidimicrobiia bacterium]|nr:lysine--tRNA ligase [Acidimicrobiia bacterium]
MTAAAARESALAAGAQHDAAVETDERVRLAGRVMLWRHMGKRLFGQLLDRSGTVQVALFRDDFADPEEYRRLAKGVRLGDFLGVEGVLFVTDKGEPTLGGLDATVLNRAHEPLPDKHAGLVDTDLRYRKRYLDLLANPDSRQRFLVRSALISGIRRWLDDREFIEVETPMLQAAASGAAATPFSTHHDALDRDFYLRISPETYLKRAVAGGLDRVYELGRNFRNEGIDSSHLQEFTMLEWYAAYWDYRDNMVAVRELIVDVLGTVLGTTVVDIDGQQVDFAAQWPEYDYRTLVAEHTGIDLSEVRTVEALKAAISERGIAEDLAEAPSYASLVDLLYKRTVRPSLVAPCYLVHHPAELVPLARRNDDDPTVLDMFQVVVNGWEIVKAYSELVDPVEQEERLLEQVRLREAGDDETMMMEDDFIEAMRHGMPPMSGLGLGIDRLVALATGATTLRDVVLFPQLRQAPGAS